MSKTVRDVMTGGAECIGERDTIVDAAKRLAEHKVRPVIDGHELIGILSQAETWLVASMKRRSATWWKQSRPRRRSSLRQRVVRRMSVRAATVLHLGLVDVPAAVREGVADVAFVRAEHAPVVVVELFDDWKVQRPSITLRPTRFRSISSASPSAPASRSRASASSSLRSASPTSW